MNPLLTVRERELLDWIDENPFISQQELAQRAGITRSSVSVHISNLMKKGYIQGKGYVVKKAPYVAVIGGANLDISGHVNISLDMGDSNPGQIRIESGGVGRNQAHNLRLLNVDVKMITAFGDDFYGDRIRQHCRDLGIDIGDSVIVPSINTSSYVSIIDQHGDLKVGVSDMDIYDSLTPALLAVRMPLINKAAICTADTNLPQETLEYLAENALPPLFVESVSRAKVDRARSILHHIHTLKTDQSELARLMGRPLDDDKATNAAVDELLDKGVKNIFLHLSAENRVLCADAQQRLRLSYRTSNDRAVYKNGTQDSFMAALIWAHMQGLTFEQTARVGLEAAQICASSIQIVNDNLNADCLLDAIK